MKCYIKTFSFNDEKLDIIIVIPCTILNMKVQFFETVTSTGSLEMDLLKIHALSRQNNVTVISINQHRC